MQRYAPYLPSLARELLHEMDFKLDVVFVSGAILNLFVHYTILS